MLAVSREPLMVRWSRKAGCPCRRQVCCCAEHELFSVEGGDHERKYFSVT